MKKVIAVLAVVLMFSGAAFASPAELIGLGGLPVQFTNLDDNALLNPALLGNFANKAVIGISYPVPSNAPEATGLVILGAGPGILMIGAGPRSFGSVDLLSTGSTYGIPDSTFNLGYALDLSGIKAGISVGYGVDNASDKALWAASTELIGKDENATSRTALKVALGAALEGDMGIDAAVSLSMPGYSTENKDYDNVNNVLQNNDKTKWGGMDIAIDAKGTIASMILALNVTLSSLQQQVTDWQDADLNGTADTNNVTTIDDSSLDVSLLAGKVIKANDNLTVTLGSGVNLATNGATKSVTENKLTSVKTINSADVSTGMIITVPFNLAVNVNLGKLLTISNDKLAASIGISKEVIVLNNHNVKSINTADESINSLADHSTLSNVTPVTGAVGLKWELGDSKVNLAAGADVFPGTGITPVLGASFVYDWK
jgi:hypothetical protein